MRCSRAPTGYVMLLLACCFLACLCGCTSRTELPLPVQPFTPTPDAPFRTRQIAAYQVPIPELRVERHVLANGLTVLHVERHGLPYVAVEYVNPQAGTLTSEYAGELVQLTATSLVRAGSRWRDGGVLSDVRVNGERIVAVTDADATTLGLRAITAGFEQTMEVLARTVRGPLFEPGGVELARVDSLSEVRNASYLTGNLAWEHVLKGMIGEESTSQLLAASSRRMKAFGVEQIKACHADLYRPETSAVVVVGAVSLAESVAVVNRHFGSWSAAQPARAHRRKVLALRLPARGVRFQVIHARGQAEVFIAQRAPAILSEEFVPASLASIVLGGLFDSRMNHALRHGAAVTYGVHSDLAAMRDLGLLLVHGQFEVQSAAQAIREILGELRALQDEPLSAAEVELARVRFSVELRSALSDNAATARLVSRQFYHGAPDVVGQWRQALSAADAAKVQEVARRYLHPHNIDIVIFGDASRLYDDLSAIGKVDLFRITNASET